MCMIFTTTLACPEIHRNVTKNQATTWHTGNLRISVHTRAEEMTDYTYNVAARVPSSSERCTEKAAPAKERIYIYTPEKPPSPPLLIHKRFEAPNQQTNKPKQNHFFYQREQHASNKARHETRSRPETKKQRGRGGGKKPRPYNTAVRQNPYAQPFLYAAKKIAQTLCSCSSDRHTYMLIQSARVSKHQRGVLQVRLPGVGEPSERSPVHHAVVGRPRHGEYPGGHDLVGVHGVEAGHALHAP